MRESQKSQLHMPKKVLKMLYDDVDFGDKVLEVSSKEHPAETNTGTPHGTIPLKSD